MKDIAFGWEGSGRLLEILTGPFSRVSTPSGSEKFLFAIKFWLRTGRSFTVYSEMHDLHEREEVGVLKFVETTGISFDKKELAFDMSGVSVAYVNKLVVYEKGFGSIDCGVSLHLGDGAEIVVVAGSFPCSIAVRGIPGLSNKFDPEYPLGRYKREPLTT